MKQHDNRYTTAFYSQRQLEHFDGEIAAERETHPDLCRITSSALRTINGEPFTLWWLFDYLKDPSLIYAERYDALVARVKWLQHSIDPCLAVHHLRVVPYVHCTSLAQLEDQDAKWLDEGYEGSIIRDPYKPHKQGRSTVREGGLLRIKRFVDEEAVVLRYEEGSMNTNIAQINELGKTFRTTHAENMIPNGQVGTIVAKRLSDGKEINVSPGNMDAPTRRGEWFNRDKAPGRVFTYKHFPKGVKDLPRFGTWKCWRDAADMSS